MLEMLGIAGSMICRWALVIESYICREQAAAP